MCVCDYTYTYQHSVSVILIGNPPIVIDDPAMSSTGR